MTQLVLNVGLEDQATFANYIAGANEALVASLQDGDWVFNQACLYLWGQKGAGCSHLLQAVCHHFHGQGLAVAYLPLSSEHPFTPALLEGLEALKLVCIDDSDSVLGDLAWEQALCRLYNDCLQTKTPLLLSAHKPARQLVYQLPDWSSRVVSALNLEIEPLADADKLRLLEAKAKQRGLVFTQQVSQYLLNHYSRDLPTLLAWLDRFDQSSWIEQRKLTLPFIKEVLSRECL